MAVKMRLTRLGDKKSPFYRVVVSDSRKSRDGEYVDLIGTYNPLVNGGEVKLDTQKAEQWLKNGATPTETVATLLKRSGVEFKGSAKKSAPKTGKAKKSAK